MNKTYGLTWDVKRLGNKVLFNKTYTTTYRNYQKIETVDIGAKPEDFDNIKIEVEITENLYTVKQGVSSFAYWYKPIVITGTPTGNEYGNEFGGTVTAQVYKTLWEAFMPYSDESYFSNMSVTSARQLGTVTSAGVLMRNAGKMTITIPNPLSGERKTELHPSFRLNANMQIRSYDPYEYVTEDEYRQVRFSVDWTADGKLSINATDWFQAWDHDRSNTTFKIKVTGHGVFDI